MSNTGSGTLGKEIKGLWVHNPFHDRYFIYADKKTMLDVMCQLVNFTFM